MMTTTQRLLDLAAAAPTARDDDLVLLLREASELYQQGFAHLRDTVAARFAGLSDADLVAAALAAGLLCDASQDRDELVLLLALTEWEMTPAALAYSEMAQDAARRGVCLIPEERLLPRTGRENLGSVLDPRPKLLPLCELRAGQAGSPPTGRTVLP